MAEITGQGPRAGSGRRHPRHARARRHRQLQHRRRAPTPTPTPTPKPTPTPTPTPHQPRHRAVRRRHAGARVVQAEVRASGREEDADASNTTERRRSSAAHAPQGFIGLLLDELPDKAKHFVEIDLDDPFFRVLGSRHRHAGGLRQDRPLLHRRRRSTTATPPTRRTIATQEFRLTAADPGPEALRDVPQRRARDQLPGGLPASLRRGLGLDRREAHLRDPAA